MEALKIAAIFVVALLGVRYLLPSFTANEPVAMQTIYVPAGQRVQLTLTDGTKVWGTRFNVMAYSGNAIFETSLLEGSVELLKPGTEKGVLIQPNERIFLENNHLVRAPISHFNHFLWKDGLISFDNESFPEMVSKTYLFG